jgi:O-antigen ligase
MSIWMNKGRMSVRMPWYSNGAAKILIAYTIWMWIQLPWALSFDMHMDMCILYTKYIVLFYMIYTIVDSDIRFYQFIMCNILGGFYWGYLIKGYSSQGRVEALGGPGIYDSNTLGMHLGVILVFASLMLLKKNSLFKSAFLWWSVQGVVLAAAVLMANGVVQTVSRSAVVGLMAGGIVLFLLNHKAFRKKFILYAMAAIAGFFYFTPDKFWGRMDTVKTAVQVEAGEIESSAYSRLVIAEAQLKMFRANILGHGHRGTVVLSLFYLPNQYLTRTSGQFGRSSHNTFLTTLVEQGFPGAILYWMMVFWVIKTVLSFKKEDAVVYLYVMMMAAGLTTVFISGIFVDYLKAEIQIFCLAMLASLKEYARIKKEQTPCAE